MGRRTERFNLGPVELCTSRRSGSLVLGSRALCLLSHWKQLELERGVDFSSLSPHALGCGGHRMFRGCRPVWTSASVVRVRVHMSLWCLAHNQTPSSPGRVYRLTGLFVFVV